MTNEEKQIAEDFYLRKISYAEFIEKYPQDLTQKYLLHEVNKLFKSHDGDALKYLILITAQKEFTPELGESLSKIIAEDWHREHEDIARILQFSIKIPNSVDYLVIAMNKQFKYLYMQDDYEPFVIQCMYAIADLNSLYSHDKIKEMSTSSNDIIRRAAEFQLNRLSRSKQ